MVILSHPTGNTFVRAAARALHQGGLLAAFHTTIAASDGRLPRAMPDGLRRQILRRRFEEVPPELIRTHPWREVARLSALALGTHRLTRPGGWVCIDAVYESFDRHVARTIERLEQNGDVGRVLLDQAHPGDSARPEPVEGRAGKPITAVYAYEDAAEQTFLAARDKGFACIYELPIAYWETTQRLLKEEAERLPEWRRTLRGLEDSPRKLERKTREIELADTVVVPSRFVLDTLPRRVRDTKRCIVAPFGSPPVTQGSSPAALSSMHGAAEEKLTPRPLRVLFAGAMTQRKGLADLFAAMHLLHRPDVELIVMGSLLAPMSFYRRQYPDFVYQAPRPHDQVLALMRSCDVLVLPAIVEGRALVQQEALASGLPIIVTRNAGGEDLVERERTGFLVPIRSPETLADRLAWFADHCGLLPDMRACALRMASDTGWVHYEAQVLEAVNSANSATSPGVALASSVAQGFSPASPVCE